MRFYQVVKLTWPNYDEKQALYIPGIYRSEEKALTEVEWLRLQKHPKDYDDFKVVPSVLKD